MLLARKRDGSPLTIKTAEEKRRFAGYRRELIEGEIKFSQILEREELILAGDCLHYFSHWITPEPLPLRYDVRFFLARPPEGQSAASDGVELTSHVWLRPSQALSDYNAGRIDLVLPQLMTISEVSRFSTVEETFDSVKNRDVPVHLTKLRNLEGENVENNAGWRFFSGTSACVRPARTRIDSRQNFIRDSKRSKVDVTYSDNIDIARMLLNDSVCL